MFEHSVKVPRNFKTAANILKKVSVEGGSVKTLLYDNKLRHFNTNVLYALIIETIKHAADLDKMFESCNLLANEPRLDPWLAKILTTELLFGKKELPGQSKPEQTILSYKEQFEKYTNEHMDVLKTEVKIRRPRYVRINTNLLTTSDAIGAFQEEGYKFIRCTSGSYDDYLKQIQNLTEYDFTQDYHVKTVFVFAAGTKLHEHDLYFENKIILQDKATALAVHLLAPPPGSVILDMCAAPGMKTTQVAAYIRNQGKIYAIEKNERRYQTLCDFVQKTESKCVETHNKDALEIKRGDFDDVEYILLDPSCSGSGMELSVHNYIDSTRLSKLTSLQEKFLKHAMNAFPKAKRIVYSTCSLYPEENERVVTNVVKTSRAKWRVQEVKELLKGNWNNYGSAMYGSMGTRCLYAKPEMDLTTGFFLAVIDRDPKDFEKSQVDGEVIAKRDVNSKKDRKRKGDLEVTPNGELDNNDYHDKVSNDSNPEVSKKKKKKNKTNVEEITENIPVDSIPDNSGTNEVDDSTIATNKTKKKKKKHQKLESYTSNIDGSMNYNANIALEGIPKNKKKNKQKDLEDNLVVDESGCTETKKKKNKQQECVDDGINESEDVITEVSKGKKKSKKHKLNQETENQEIVEFEESKKKKQKGQLYSNTADEIDYSNSNEKNGEVQKPKKKHKKEST